LIVKKKAFTLETIIDHRLTINDLCRTLDNVHKYIIEGFAMFDELSSEEVTTAVDRIIVGLLGTSGIGEPPVDAIHIAQKTLGIVVCLDGNQQARGRAQRSGRQRQIYLRPEPTKERHQWTVAHEIGEHLKADLLQALGPGA